MIIKNLALLINLVHHASGIKRNVMILNVKIFVGMELLI